jgi:FAD/FMN-containing dehydrogenase/Fe-S oxidoreductase
VALTTLNDIKFELGKVIEGEVHTDAVSRTLFSTDASIYQVQPLGVVYPRHKDDLQAAVEYAAHHRIPILPRGSGSSLAGQTVSEALVLDCSRYMNNLLEVDIERHRALVQPGIVLNTLNKKLAAHRLKFGPDPASADRATLGGMMGNNSTGAHSIQFGMTADHILSMDTILADGSVIELKMTSLAEAAQLAEGDSVAGGLFRAALAIRDRYGDEIQSAWPQVWRRASGYSLNYLTGWSATQPVQWFGTPVGEMYPPVLPGHVNMPGLMVGSEGTLAVFQQAWIHLVPTPAKTVLGVLQYDSVAAASDATPALLELRPSAVELLPKALIDRARSVPAYANRLHFVKGDPAAILLIEFEGDDDAKLLAQAKQLGSDAVIAITPEEQNAIWAVRKVGLGLLMSIKGDTKPLPFVEDVAVPVEQLGDFVREFERICERFGTHGDFYAHASAGCLHIRPLINLKTQTGIDAMIGITKAVAEATLRYGGALSGEHGDGLARSEWLDDTFSPGLMSAFRQLKQAADPDNILNPRNMVNAPPMSENLRYGVEYQADPWIPMLNFDNQGGLLGAIEMCNGAGVCRREEGVMCPSFKATHDEMHATRGRANLLRGFISGNGHLEGIAEQAAFEALDLCLECKACAAECPSGVDMAKLKYEFLDHYYESHRRPLKDFMFAYIDRFAALARPVAPLANWITHNALGKWVAEILFGISAQRDLPKFTSRRYRLPAQTDAAEKVLLLVDPFSEYFYPELIEDAVKLLHVADCAVHVLPLTGAGRTLISKGFLKQAKKHAQDVLAKINELDPHGALPILGIEPSDIFTLRDEFPSLFPGDEHVRSIAARTYMLDEFLIRPDPGSQPRIQLIRGEIEKNKHEVLLHGHCYQKAQAPAADGLPTGASATLALLSGLGIKAEMIESTCCGMAGSFGYEADHFEVSMQVGELDLFPAVRAANGRPVLASGVSCRSQIETGTQIRSIHPISFIAQHL